MPNFFRRLRQNKMKSSQYLKYALGEILLVVFGILIALSINNWNEGRKKAAQETFYFSQLLEDALADSYFIKAEKKGYQIPFSLIMH